MTPSPQIVEEGLRAYEQARAFEALQRKRMPLIYGAITLLLAVSGALTVSRSEKVGTVVMIIAVLNGVLSWRHWTRLCAQHTANLEKLAQLQSAYGEELPWLQVERHLAALDELKRDLNDERSG